ncbi:MAG: 50S ribosomal protein L6 [Gammaproteobacteria bacterium]
MSRVAKRPIPFDNKHVKVTINDGTVLIKGKKGEESFKPHKKVKVECFEDNLKVSGVDETEMSRMHAGTARSILSDLVEGVTNGYEIKMILVGVGYKAQVNGKMLQLTLGFSHPVAHEIPKEVTIETPSQTEIVIRGTNAQVVGEVAAKIRRYRQPDSYKGKGLRFANEQIILKETKKK